MSEKIYACLLKLYPRRFRSRYAPDALQLFRDRLQAERGFFQRVRFWSGIIADLAISVPREHLRPNPARPDPAAYRLTEEAVTAMCKHRNIAPAVLFCVFVLLGFATGWLGDAGRLPLLIAYSLIACKAAARLLRIGTIEKRCRSYELILGSDRIRQRDDRREVTVFRSEIDRIAEGPQGLLVVGSSRTILAPLGLTGYQEVRDRLSEWAPITQQADLWPSFPEPMRKRIQRQKLEHRSILCLLPAILLVHSLHGFLAAAAIYYGVVSLVILMRLARPQNGPYSQKDWAPLVLLTILPLAKLVFLIATRT